MPLRMQSKLYGVYNKLTAHMPKNNIIDVILLLVLRKNKTYLKELEGSKDL